VNDKGTGRHEPAAIAGKLTDLLGEQADLAGGEHVCGNQVLALEEFDGHGGFRDEGGGPGVDGDGHAFVGIGGEEMLAGTGEIESAAYGVAGDEGALAEHIEGKMGGDAGFGLQRLDGKLRGDDQAVVENGPDALAAIRGGGGHGGELLRNQEAGNHLG